MWRNLSKCLEKYFFLTLGQISSHLDKFFNTFLFFLVFSWKNTLFLKTRKNAKKHSPSLIVLSQCSKNYPRIICFFSGFSIRKMAASDHSEVSAYGLDLKKNLGSHFRNLKTLEKKQIILGQFFFTPREDNAWRKVPFPDTSRKYRQIAMEKCR